MKSYYVFKRVCLIIFLAFIKLFPIFFIFSFLIFGDYKYEFHESCSVEQTRIFFVDNDGNSYFESEKTLYRFTNNRSYESCEDLCKTESGDLYYWKAFSSNGDYLFILLSDLQINDNVLYVYNKDMSLVSIKHYPLVNMRVLDMEEYEGVLYIIFENFTTKNTCLFYLKPFETRYGVIKEDLNENEVIIENNVRIFLKATGHNANRWVADTIRILKDKTRLIYVSKKEMILEKYKIGLDDENLRISIEDDIYIFPFSKKRKRLYELGYLDNNKLIFALYDHYSSNNCLNGYCICQYEKSFLYSFDINSHELEVIKSFKDRTFLIDYDLESVCYYSDCGVYLNDSLVRECEEIKEGEMYKASEIEIRTKYHYFMSYYNGEVYGI